MLPGYGGFTAAARELTTAYQLNRQGKPFTRQQIWAWWNRRGNNGFPEADIYTYNTAAGHQVQLYKLDLAKVVTWYATYVPSKGGRRKRETENGNSPEAEG
jgi:hypothetical protein